MRKLKWLVPFVLMASLPTRVLAMEFSTVTLDDGDLVLVATGEIVARDDLKLHNFVGQLPSGSKISFISLQSVGGSLIEGMHMARTVRASHLATAVPNNSVCASACFLMFAAGQKRVTSETGRVGVHSASSKDNGENTMSQAATIQMAREASDYGVPSDVIGKMVTTLNSGIYWLTPADLREMDVVIVPSQPVATSYQPGSALVPGGASTPAPVVPSYAPPVASNYAPPPGSEVDPAFRQGLADRHVWEDWFNSLSGDYKTGAEWWANNRKNVAKYHLNCTMQPASPDFVNGCLRAQRLLTPNDRMRLAEPAYRAGWNSL